MFTSNNTTDMKCNKTPVGPLQLLFLMEAFSTLAELIRIIVDKKLYLVSISWPPEDIKSTPPLVLPIMMDQVDLTPAELHPTWLPSISKPDVRTNLLSLLMDLSKVTVGPTWLSLDDPGNLSLGPDGN